jgi:SAM-dependent MidA family methyltransferase
LRIEPFWKQAKDVSTTTDETVNQLREKLVREIRDRGPIPFSRYMEICLYDPEFGYYSRNAEQFGKAGDFYTSSDVHAVFGRLMARQFDEMWRVLGSPDRLVLREFGPGRGLYAKDVLDWSEKKFPDFFAALRYELVEQSPTLRLRLEEALPRHIGSGRAKIAAATSPGTDGRGATPVAPKEKALSAALAAEAPTIIFANEFFDALPVEIVSSHGSLRISADREHFVETWAKSCAEELEFLDRYSIHPEPGERIEVPLRAQTYMSEMAKLQRGFIVVIDYGYTREEQLAGRHRGTLKAIRQHSVSANPYEAPGEQDITADVNFTALAAVAQKQGMQIQKLITQSQFLMGIGEANQFADAFEDCHLPQERAKVALQLKHLVTPAGMGESFHVLVSSKGIEEEKVAALAGLNFGRDLRRPNSIG